MKSIQTTAIILWGFIFMVAAFILGQFLISKDIFDVTGLFTINEDKENKDKENKESSGDELESDVLIDKVGQETVRIGLNIAENYFSEYYTEYVNYIMADSEKYMVNSKTNITNDLASDYAFYVLSNSIDDDKYVSEENEDKTLISEGNLNSFIDKMFAKEVSAEYKQDVNNGYDKKTKMYNITKNKNQVEYMQELTSIENITSNQIKLEFKCKEVVVEDKKTSSEDEIQVNIYIVYRGGRYILTDVEKIVK